MMRDFEAREASIASAERALIATVLCNGDEMKHAELLLPQDFASPSHQTLWAEILAFHHDGQLSLQAVAQSLEAKELVQDLGHEFGSVTGPDYLNEALTYAAPQSTAYFSRTVLDFSTKRAIRRSAALLAADADRMDIDADEILDKVESDILSLRRNRGREGSTIASILDFFETVTEQRRSDNFVPALTPHIIPIKAVLKFYESSDYAIIAARPGDGKSSIIRYEAFYEAMEGRDATIFNLENGELEYARHLISLQTKINNELLRAPSALSANQMQAIKDAIRRLKSIPLRIITMGSPPVNEVARMYLDAVRQGTRSVFLDYIQLINNRTTDLNVNVTISSTTLRGLALKHQVPIVMASQMSRNIVNRGSGAEPELSDLRDSGSLEQDATHVLFPRMAWGPNPTIQDIQQFPENRDGAIVSVPLRVYIKKNRNGPVGETCVFKWDRSTNDFLPLQVRRP